jgi:hypothetical protein
MECVIAAAVLLLLCTIGLIGCVIEEQQIKKEIERCEQRLRNQKAVIKYLREAMESEKEALLAIGNRIDETDPDDKGEKK